MGLVYPGGVRAGPEFPMGLGQEQDHPPGTVGLQRPSRLQPADRERVRETERGGPSMSKYTFDILSVATFRGTAPDYQTARRAAEGVMEFNARDNTVDDSTGIADIVPVVQWELTCVAPRGKASLADNDDTGENIGEGEYQTFA